MPTTGSIFLIFPQIYARKPVVLSANPHIHDGSLRNGGFAREKREERDSLDVRALSLHVALFSPVSLSQTWAIGAEALSNNSG